MLVLSRKAGEELIIGDSIRITVNKISGNRVTLGIVAPGDVRVLRGELEPIARSFEEPADGGRKENAEKKTAVPSPGVVMNAHPGTVPFVPPAAR